MHDDSRPTTTLGARVRHYRLMRGMPLRLLADLAGISAGWLSRVERGERSLERRTHIEALAAALDISATELLGQPFAYSDREHSRAHAQLEGIRAVLIGVDLGEGGLVEAWRPMVELDRLSTQARVDLCRHGDVGAAVAHLPGLLAELHAHVVSGPDREAALRVLILVAVTASSACGWLGSRELSWLAAGRAREAARELGDPALIGLAEWRAVGAARPYAVALTRSEAAAAGLEDIAGDDTGRLQVLTMLHLHAAMDAAVIGRSELSADHYQAGAELAGRVFDAPDPWELYLGPGNLALWQMSLAVELGEPGRTRSAALTSPASAVPSKSRQATYYQDLGRALAVCGRHREAALCLRQAERISPASIRVNALAQGLAMDLLPHLPRAAGGAEIRALAHRMGIIA